MIGHWNVRSLYRGGATAQVAREMEGYKVDILGISECRWTGAGRQRITPGQTVLYAGDEKVHEGGVAIMMSKRAERALMEWTLVRERIITARFYSRFRRLLVIQVYAPHNEREEEEKDHFYEELLQTIYGCKRNDIVVVMGDFNAKVGGDNGGYESCIGRHGMGNKNDNGERLCDFSVSNGLVITGTLFQHKDIHKATWVSANGRVKNQIDHPLISRRLKSAVLDTIVQRGADVNCDHYLVRTKSRLKLSKCANIEKFKLRFNTDKPKDRDTKRMYCEAVRRRLEENRGEEREEVEELWEALRKAYL